MIREKKAKKQVSGNKAFLVVILLSVGIIILSTLVGFIENRFGIKRLENVIYIIVLIVAYFLIKNYLTEYRYSFIDDELIVEKILGKKTTPIVTIKTREIEHFGKLSDIDWVDKEMHVDYCDINKGRAYAIKYIQKNETKIITLSPSEELIMHIKKAIEARDYDEVVEEKLIK